MKGIEFLAGELPSEIRELDSADPRLEDIVKLVEAEQWGAASEAVEALFVEGVFDIRPIVQYLWVLYRRDGIATLVELFGSLRSLTGANIDRISPVKRRADHVKRRVSWVLQQIAGNMEFHESRATSTWAEWERTSSSEDVDGWIAAARDLDAALSVDLEEIKQPLGLLVSRLRRLHIVVEPAKPKEETVIESPATAADTTASTAEVTSEPATTIRIGSQTAVVELRPAHQFFELAEKLKAFSALVERKDFAKAAIVADDLTQVIEHFDPRTYFPSMFSDFAKLMSEHISEVAAQWANKDSLSWRAQAEFYKVDLKRFVAR